MEGEVIVIRAFNTKKQQSVTCRPCLDRTGRLYTGQGKAGYFENLTKEEKENLPFIIDHSTKVVLSDGKVLKMDDLLDSANWKWLQRHPYLVLDKGMKASSRDAVFYVENRKAEAAQRVKGSRDKDQARYLVQFGLSLERLRYIAKVMGNMSPESFSEDELRDWLLQLCETVPAAIVAASNPELSAVSEATITFNDLKKWHLIQKHKGGVYRYGGETGPFMGHTDDRVIEFIMNPANKETVAAMTTELDIKLGRV